MSAFTLGQSVRFKNRLRRMWQPSEGWHQPAMKAWERMPEWLPQPVREGVIVGHRTLANGKVRFGGEDNPTTFTPTERISAYLVAYDLRRKPVFVLPEDLEPAS